MEGYWGEWNRRGMGKGLGFGEKVNEGGCVVKLRSKIR